METSSIAIDSNSDAWHSRMPDLAVRVSQHDHIIGAPDAPVTLVQYGDYECATCSDVEPAVKALLGRYRRGIRFVFRHFPQNTIHPRASLAAQAAEAAGAQGKFWEMHDLLLHNWRHLAEAEITHLALAAGVEIYRFSAELARGEYARRVRADFLGGLRSGVSQTPTFFVNGARISGLRGFNAVSSTVECILHRHA